jgi:hypothetical protein
MFWKGLRRFEMVRDGSPNVLEVYLRWCLRRGMFWNVLDEDVLEVVDEVVDVVAALRSSRLLTFSNDLQNCHASGTQGRVG